MVTSIVSSSSYSLASFSLKSNANVQDQAVGKIASGSQASSGQNPMQVDSVSLRIKTSASLNANIVSNIGNALSFLEAQSNSLNHIASLVSSLGDITSKMKDPQKSDTELKDYMQEFQSLRLQLTNERNATYGDQYLHNTTSHYSEAFSVQMNSDGTRSSNLSASDFLTNSGWDTLIGSPYADTTPDPGATITSTTGSNSPTDPGTSYGVGGAPVVINSPDPTPTHSFVGQEGYGSEGVTDKARNLVDVWGTASFDSLITSVSSMLAENASQQNTLRHGLDSLSARSADLTALNGAITDTNLAHEVTTLAKTQLLNQSASSAFAQTNVSAEGVVKALWGEISSGVDWYKPEVLRSILPKIAFA